MSFPNSQIGLPESLNYKLPPSMSENSRAYSVQVQPDGITSVTGPNQAFSFTANVPTTNQFTPAQISFTLPSGNSEATFLDPTHTTVSFSLTYTIGTAGTGLASQTCNLISSAASFIDSLILYSNNVPLETIGNYGQLQAFLLNNTCNISERAGGVGICLASDTTGTQGIDLPIAAGSYRFNFVIPLISLIGINGTDRLIPIGSISNMQLVLNTSNLAPVVTMCSTVTTSPTFTAGFQLVDWSLNMKYLDIGESSAALLRNTAVDNKYFIKTMSYLQSAVTLPIGSQGQQGLLMQLRASSAKSIFNTFGIATGVVSPNGLYDSINICANQRQIQCGGQFFPTRPLNDVTQPAVGYAYTIQSLGGSIAKNYGSSVLSNAYNTVGGVAAIPAGADTRLVIPALANNQIQRAPYAGDNLSATNVVSFNSCFYNGYDLEKATGSNMYNGLNTRSASPYLNLNLSAPLTSTVQMNAWAYCDVILAVDLQSKTVQAFI